MPWVHFLSFEGLESALERNFRKKYKPAPGIEAGSWLQPKGWDGASEDFAGVPAKPGAATSPPFGKDTTAESPIWRPTNPPAPCIFVEKL